MRLSSKTALLAILTVCLLAVAFASPLVQAQSDDGSLSLNPEDERLRGLVRPSKQVKLNAPLDGRVETISVVEGQHVEAGAELARMDDAIQKAVVAAARMRAENDAEIRRQKLLLEEADIQLDRMTELEKTGAAQEWELRRQRLQRDANAAALDAAKNEKQLAEQNVRLEEAKLERYSILAPFDGMVVRIDTEAGASLTNRDTILTFFQMDPLEAVLFLPVELYGKLEPGGTYQFIAEEPVNTELTGTLKTIEPSSTPRAGRFAASSRSKTPKRNSPPVSRSACRGRNREGTRDQEPRDQGETSRLPLRTFSDAARGVCFWGDHLSPVLSCGSDEPPVNGASGLP